MIAGELERLIEAITQSWDAATAYQGKWCLANPALGQCAVTAIAIQKRLGGEIVRAGKVLIDGKDFGSHYWNRLPGGVFLDLTIDQFRLPITLCDVDFNSPETLLRNADTQLRYELLEERITYALDRL